jgi:hypothetical protein
MDMTRASGSRLLPLMLGLLFMGACFPAKVDLESVTFLGITLGPALTPQDALPVLGPPEEETRTPRWLWRAPRLHMKYYSRGFELVFDSQGRTYDPLTARFLMLYIFLQPEQRYSTFAGNLSKGIAGGWDLLRLEKALGSPESTRQVEDELEWVYPAARDLQLVFIARAANREVKALMIIRRDRERPI